MHRKAIGPGRIFSDDGEGAGAQIGFKAGSMVKMTPDDLYRAGSGAEKLHLGVKPKSGKLIAPFQQFKLTLNHGPLQTILDLSHGQIGSVDLLMARATAS